jgi:hypothetical protein
MYCIWLNQQLAQTALSSDSQVCKLDEVSGIPKEPTLSFFKGKIIINPLDKDPKASLGENIKTHATIIHQISIQPAKGDFRME